MLKEITQDAGLVFRELRKAKGLTQASLAKRIGLQQSHVAKIEAGRTDVRLSTLVALFQVLGLDLAVGDPLTIRAARALSHPKSRSRFG